MKIALCLFGLPRGNEMCWKSVCELDSDNIDYDIFAHIWKLTDKVENWHGASENHNNVNKLFKYFVNSSSISAFNYEKQNKLTPEVFTYNGNKIFYNNQCNMWRSIVNVTELVLKNEALSDLQYDLLIYTRTDILFKKKLGPALLNDFDNSSHELMHGGVVYDDGLLNAEDLFFVCKRDSVGKFLDIYEKSLSKFYVQNDIYNPLEFEFSIFDSPFKFKTHFELYRSPLLRINRLMKRIGF